jgi:pimeloyl-ACP methyl ester carboxylesterase
MAGHRFVDAAGYRTRYWEDGVGDTVLLLHSADPGSSGHLEYRRNLGPLSKQFHVVAPDIIGFGGTDAPRSLLTHPAYVEHVLAFMDAAGIQRANVVGNSRGGLIAISIAAEQPERVSRLVLAGASGGGLPAEQIPKSLGPFADYVPGRESLRAVLQRSFFDLDRDVPPEVFEEYLRQSVIQYTAYAEQGGYPMDVPDLRPLLATLRMPVLYVFGRDDRVFPIEAAYAAFTRTPNSRLYALSDCGHHPQTEKAQEFNLLTERFFGGDLF